MLRSSGVMGKRNVGAGLMLQDASNLMLARPAPLPLKRQPTLPHGPDPWMAEYPENPKPHDKTHDPLRDFRKEKNNVEKGAKNESEMKTMQSPVKQPQHIKPFQPYDNDSQASKNNKMKNTNGENQQDKPNSVASKPQQNLPANFKTPEPKQQEDRKLELEGAPKNRKVNPLDRVVAKLSGKTEERSDGEEPRPGGTIKNVTVNLTELMANDDEESEVRKKRSLYYCIFFCFFCMIFCATMHGVTFYILLHCT